MQAYRRLFFNGCASPPSTSCVEALTLVQTKIGGFPIIFVGTVCWGNLFDWIKNVMLGDERNISTEGLDLVHIVDDATGAMRIINDFYKKYSLSSNF